MRLSCFLHSHPSVGMFIPYSTVNFVHILSSLTFKKKIKKIVE